MLNSKTYLKILFFILGAIATTTVAYSYYFSKNYPLPITDRISLDAKIQFIREKIDVEQVDTLVVGSSIALNNVQGVVLEKSSSQCRKVLNLSVWSIGAIQVEQLLLLSTAFPNLERIIYSAQFSDFGNKLKFKNFDSEFIKKYISHTLNPIEYTNLILNGCKDVSFCIERQKRWKEEYGMNNKFSFLNFDHTGSAALQIYGKDIIKKRWNNPHGPQVEGEAFNALDRMSKEAKGRGIKFYFIQQPYRQPLIDKYPFVKKIMETFPKRVLDILSENGGHFFNLHQKLHMSDKYFSDRSHLNDKGSMVGSKAIGKFIDMSEK